MIFNSLTCQIAIIAAGVVWPMYLSFKAVNSNQREALREWLIYWIVFSVFLTAQWVGDATIFWLPLYYEIKVAFVVLMWHPRVKGALYLFDTHLKPLFSSHEAQIDRTLSESKTKALDMIDSQIKRAKHQLSGLTGSSSSNILDSMQRFVNSSPSTNEARKKE